MKYRFPSGARLYCRTCRSETQHSARDTIVYCRICHRETRAVEVASLYATDDDSPRPRIILPARLMPGYVEEETDDPTG